MAEFLAGEAIEADYTATVYVEEGYFDLSGKLTFILDVDPVEVEPADFIAAFNAAIADIKVNDETVATANMDRNENISVTFKTSDADEILAGAGVVFNALRDLAADGSTITINGETFTLEDSLDIPALAQAILDGKMDEFLAGEAIEADYTATVYVEEGYFDLSGKLTFILDVDPVEVEPADFIAAFNAAIADIKVNDETVATAEYGRRGKHQL
ncbi:MAG: hypothetical protein ACOX27_06630 [Caldicoprobacterales bacterium]